MSTVWCRCQEDGSRWCRSFSCCSSGVSQLLHRVCYINVYSFLSIYDGWLLSTHADRQGVDISFTVCLFFVCTVTDFSGEDKASGVKFCTVVHRRPGQGMSHFKGNFASPDAKNRSLTWQQVYTLTHRKRHAADAPFVEYRAACERRSACVDIPHWRTCLDHGTLFRTRPNKRFV